MKSMHDKNIQVGKISTFKSKFNYNMLGIAKTPFFQILCFSSATLYFCFFPIDSFRYFSNYAIENSILFQFWNKFWIVTNLWVLTFSLLEVSNFFSAPLKSMLDFPFFSCQNVKWFWVPVLLQTLIDTILGTLDGWTVVRSRSTGWSRLPYTT